MNLIKIELQPPRTFHNRAIGLLILYCAATSFIETHNRKGLNLAIHVLFSCLWLIYGVFHFFGFATKAALEKIEISKDGIKFIFRKEACFCTWSNLKVVFDDQVSVRIDIYRGSYRIPKRYLSKTALEFLISKERGHRNGAVMGES